MAKGKNILFVVNIYFVIPYFFGEQLKYLQNSGYNIHIICSPSSDFELFCHQHQYEYKCLPILRRFSLLQDIMVIIHICRYIKMNDINIVSGHTPKGALLSVIAAYLTRVPKRIYFRHGLVYETSTGIKKFILKNTDRITAFLATKVVCVSNSVLEKSVEDRLSERYKQIVLLKGTCNGIDVEKFNNQNIRKEEIINLKQKLSIPLNNFVIGYTGRIVKDKGIIDLVQAFSILNTKYNNITLLLVGMYEERDALPRETIDLITKENNIICTGYIDNSIIEKYYAMMNVFILPSYREGFPTSVLEASAMCLPILTTQETGCVDSIINAETGFYITHAPTNIAKHIESLILDKELREKLGKKGRLFVINNFSQMKIWHEIKEKLY